MRPPSSTNSAPVTKAEFVAKQIEAKLGDLGGCAEAPERYGGRKTFAGAHRIAELRNHSIRHRPFDEGRMHRIAAHRRLLPRAMERYRFGEQPHAAL